MKKVQFLRMISIFNSKLNWFPRYVYLDKNVKNGAKKKLFKKTALELKIGLQIVFFIEIVQYFNNFIFGIDNFN